MPQIIRVTILLNALREKPPFPNKIVTLIKVAAGGAQGKSSGKAKDSTAEGDGKSLEQAQL